MNANKRGRNLNFSREETEKLVSLVEDEKKIIENKKSDAVTWKDKEEAWKRIETIFNSSAAGIFRSAKHLKVKYESLKRNTRKKASFIRAELYKTGGGANEAPPLTAVEEKIKHMIMLSVEGGESIYDSDHVAINIEDGYAWMDVPSTSQVTDTPVPSTSQVTDTEIPVQQPCTVELDITETPSKKWAKWKPSNLKSKKHPALCKPREKRPFDKLVEAKLELVELQKKIIEEELEEKLLKNHLIKEEIQQKKELFALDKEERLLKIDILNHELECYKK